jgi:hypothetical protein
LHVFVTFFQPHSRTSLYSYPEYAYSCLLYFYHKKGDSLASVLLQTLERTLASTLLQSLVALLILQNAIHYNFTTVIFCTFTTRPNTVSNLPCICFMVLLYTSTLSHHFTLPLELISTSLTISYASNTFIRLLLLFMYVHSSCHQW